MPRLVLSRVARLTRTLAHLSLRQIGTRARHLIVRGWWWLTGASARASVDVRWKPFLPVRKDFNRVDEIEELNQDVQAARDKAKALQFNRFNLLGKTKQFGDEVDWEAREETQLWRFHLHSFAYARSLIVGMSNASGDEAYRVFRTLSLSWIRANKRLQGDGWRPYTLSLRIVHWLEAISIWEKRLADDPSFNSILRGSVYFQAKVLRGNMEFDLRGNHLIENVRALVWAGVAYDTTRSKEWLKTAMSVLEAETKEQVLPDGGHIERVPGYHTVVLGAYIEIGMLLEINTGCCPDFVRDAARRMAHFLHIITDGAGRLPLFKDTTIDTSPSARDTLMVAASWLNIPAIVPKRAGLEAFLMLGAAKWKQSERRSILPTGAYWLRESGYLVLRSLDEHFVADAGTPGPRYLMGHAHADTFSFEYTIEGEPVVVDSGIYEYSAGEWRSRFRSTRAHNTVEIDGEDSSEVWSSFRVGRRATVALRHLQYSETEALLVAAHSGFAFLEGSPSHCRCYIWIASEILIIADLVVGGGTHSVMSRVHFHPFVDLVATQSGNWILRTPKATVYLATAGWRTVVEERGWYSPKFGELLQTAVIRFGAEDRLPVLGVIAFSRHCALELSCELRGIYMVIDATYFGKRMSFQIDQHGAVCAI